MAGEGKTVTDKAGVEVIVTCELEDLVESATEIAETVTVAGLGSTEGAVYSPPAEMVPCAESPPVTPFTCQVTPVFAALVTVAENVWVAPVWTVAFAGDTLTEMTGGGLWPPLLPELAHACKKAEKVRRIRNKGRESRRRRNPVIIFEIRLFLGFFDSPGTTACTESDGPSRQYYV